MDRIERVNMVCLDFRKVCCTVPATFSYANLENTVEVDLTKNLLSKWKDLTNWENLPKSLPINIQYKYYEMG